nr:Ig-like domain-containing protein [Pontibacter sp. 172403-2]
MTRRWYDVLKTVLVSYTTPPIVEITTPEDHTVHKVGHAISLSARASDREETVERVEFFANCKKIGEDLTSPYEINWIPSNTGGYTLSAEATDGTGARGGSQPLYVDVAEVVTGKITREYWDNVQGSSVSSIPVTTAPKSVTELSSFATPTNVADSYGQRVRGYLTAPVTGEYTFWIASDDYSELWLSTSTDPADKVKLAYVNGWTKSQEWSKYRTQQSVKVKLEVGQRYYIEALHLENSGSDNLAVGWQLPDGSMERPIPGPRLTPYEKGTTPPPAVIYNLSVDVVGIGSITPEKGTFLEGEVVTLKAAPAMGYKFSGWSGDAFGANNPQSIVMHKNMNVTATFTRVEETDSLVSSVTSNTGKRYALAELTVGTKVYTDRTYQATSVPAFLSGARFVPDPE